MLRGLFYQLVQQAQMDIHHLSDVITALQADADYAAAPFTIDISSGRMQITLQRPGDQGDINITFSKTVGNADVNFDTGGYDGSIITPSRNGIVIKLDFQMADLITLSKHLLAALRAVMH